MITALIIIAWAISAIIVATDHFHTFGKLDSFDIVMSILSAPVGVVIVVIGNILWFIFRRNHE